MSVKKGVLHVIATPIGNLSDMTMRAIEVMREVDVLYAEDTRHTGQLCAHLGISPKLRSLHEHNEKDRVDEVIGHLQSGNSVGYVSDAGTPLISDPGYRIVSACHRAGLIVSPVPGVSALTAALSVSGLPTDRFMYQGFLPAKSGARRAALELLSAETATLVFFESKHRVIESLQDMQQVLGDRVVCIARELTKTYETVLHGRFSDLLLAMHEKREWHKGEFVLVVSGAPGKSSGGSLQLSKELQSLLIELADELPPRKAARIVASHSGINKKMLYDWLIDQKAD